MDPQLTKEKIQILGEQFHLQAWMHIIEKIFQEEMTFGVGTLYF